MLLITLFWTVFAAVVPLSDVDFDVAVSGPLADVRITQTFHNPTDQAVEAVYLFPLHERAVVDEMVIRLEGRTIEGRIEEVGAAREQYARAIAAGKTAALTESVRWNLFRQTVGNIPPGAQIEVSMRIIQPVPRIDGEYELVLPLVAGARFVEPGASDSDALSTPYEDDGVRANVHLAVDGGVSMQGFRVPSHRVFVSPTGEGWEAHAADLSMDRDFVARWGSRSDAPQVGALSDGSHLLLVFEPPRVSERSARRKRRVTLVIDRSGSMAGSGWERAIDAVEALLSTMDGAERLSVITFGDQMLDLGERAVTDETRALLLQEIRATRAGGGSFLRPALSAALARPDDPGRQHYIVVLSDGLVDDEVGILQDLAAYQGKAKISAIGVGRAVNRFVLGEIASQGGGLALQLRGTEGVEAIEELVGGLDRPVMSEVQVDWGDWGASDSVPARIPDVQMGRPIQVLARTQYEAGGPITVRGRVDGEPVEWVVRPRSVQRGRAIGSTWARQQIEALGRRQIRAGIPAREEGLPLALEYGILSPWTAFIAIDSRQGPVQVATSDEPPARPVGSTAPLPASTPPPPELEYPSEPERDFEVDGVLLRQSAPGVQADSTDEVSLDTAHVEIDGWAGSTQGLGGLGSRFSLSFPVAVNRFALALDTSPSRSAVDGGSWTSLPGRTQMVLGLGGQNRLALDLAAARQSILAPTVDTLEAQARSVAVKLALSSENSTLSTGWAQTRFGCLGCSSAIRTRATVGTERRTGPQVARGVYRLRFARTGFEGDLNRNTSDLGAEVGFSLRERGYLELRLASDALWRQGRPTFLPSGRAEIGAGGVDRHLAVGFARVIDTRTPELALPTQTRLFLTGVIGEEWGPRIGAELSWERAEGPLALDIRRLRALPDQGWRRDAMVASLSLKTPEAIRGELGLQSTLTQVLSTDADLASAFAPWVPGLLIAHRPWVGTLDGRVSIGPELRLTDFTLRAAVGSPVGGDRWWSGWQATGELGLYQNLDGGKIAFGVLGTARRGRPLDVDLDRSDGWISPERLRRYGVFGTLRIRL